MIDKEEFYRGAALATLLEGPNNVSVRGIGRGHYSVNETTQFLIRYSTKARTPWRFALDLISYDWSDGMFLVLVCGGDGVCVIQRNELDLLLAERSGWISIGRTFNSQYSVSGSTGCLTYKIPQNRWPSAVIQRKAEYAGN